MTFRDILAMAWHSIWFHRQRSILTMLGILIGIASVILLTSIGEGTRTYVLSEFTQFGTTLVGILLFKEPADLWRLVFLSTLIASLVGLKLVSH